MIRIMAVLMFVAIACCSGAEQNGCFLSVRRIDFVVQSFSEGQATRQPDFLYCLYFGNEETEKIDRQAEQRRVTVNLSLVHPVAGTGPAFHGNTRSRWYLTQTDNTRFLMRTGPVFEQAAWEGIPALARHVLLALGPNDDELILISLNGISGSLSVFYDPRVQKDRDFYMRRLAVIQEYLRTHNLDDEIPFDGIGPAREVTFLGSRIRR